MGRARPPGPAGGCIHDALDRRRAVDRRARRPARRAALTRDPRVATAARLATREAHRVAPSRVTTRSAARDVLRAGFGSPPAGDDRAWHLDCTSPATMLTLPSIDLAAVVGGSGETAQQPPQAAATPPPTDRSGLELLPNCNPGITGWLP